MHGLGQAEKWTSANSTLWSEQNTKGPESHVSKLKRWEWQRNEDFSMALRR